MALQPSFSPVDYLRSLVYFDQLDSPAVEQLAGQLVRRTYPAGALIFMEGELASGMWMIEAGRVKVYKLSPEGGEHVLHLLGEGDTFNDIAALDRGRNPANAAALGDLVVWFLPSDALEAAILADQNLALRVIRVLAARVRFLVGQIESLALYSVVVRLARFLIDQAENPSLSGPGVTRIAIAAHLATTPQTISNALRALEDAGAIQFDRHQIVIVDEGLLRSIALL
jgi:CRP-like cAMP-binding protein